VPANHLENTFPSYPIGCDAPNAAPGDSLEQRKVEDILVAGLSEKLGVSLCKKRFTLPADGYLEVDGFSESPPVLCEAWAHQGRPKAAQKAKVLADAFKLVYAARLVRKPCRLILVFADKAAAAHFEGNSWMAQALRAHGIKTHIVELPETARVAIRKAQERQFR
jgi:hypothetical protein